MLSQNISVSTPNPLLTHPENRYDALFWQTACFHPLQPYESVNRQYEDLGIRFTHAIALRPSNPDFIPSSPGIVIMPIVGQRGVVLHLHRSLLQVQLQVIGSQSVTLSTLDGAGYCVTQGKLPNPSGVNGVPWQQCLSVETHSVRTAHISSTAPFVIHSLKVRRQAASPGHTRV